MSRALTTLALACLAGCAATNSSAPAASASTKTDSAAPRAAVMTGDAQPTPAPGLSPVKPATDADRAALIDRVKGLEGTWDVAGPGGMTGEFTFAVTSNGSVVREVMFPGSDHEMTNMYSMDGPTLVMTHYCAIGNQPRMRAAAASGDRIDLKFDNVTNLQSPTTMYMGHMVLTVTDKDHAQETWTSFVNGKEHETHAEFKLTRKK